MKSDKVNILLVDSQPEKLASYELMLARLDENLVVAGSASEAFERLLKLDVAVVLVNVRMPDINGFEFARMIREQPRFKRTAIIFVSSDHISELETSRGQIAGAVDYVPAPVVPEVLRARVRVFSELYRTSRELEVFNRELEQRVADRTSELAAANARLVESERGRSLALAAGNVGSWRYDFSSDCWHWDEGQGRIFGLSDESGARCPRTEDLKPFFLDSEWRHLSEAAASASPSNNTIQTEITVVRRNGKRRHCQIAAAASFDENQKIVRIDGVTIDITERKEAERRQEMLAREVDHRARNSLAIVQSVIRLTRDQQSTQSFREAVEGRVRALAKAHDLMSQSRWQGGDILRLVREELAPYFAAAARIRVDGPAIVLPPDRAQTLALIVHELATNAMKYGALTEASGIVEVKWTLAEGMLELRWTERGAHPISSPSRSGVGTRIITASAAATRGGNAVFDWRPEGLAFTLTIPLVPVEHSRQIEQHDGDNVVRLRTALEQRVLLVEDETLTGMFMHDLVEDLGYEVVGPVACLEDAMEAAKLQNVCAALLDVNLRGSAIDPVAKALIGRAIPIVLVTGYSGDHIDPEFARVPILRKPVAPDAVRALLQEIVAAPKQEPAAVLPA